MYHEHMASCHAWKQESYQRQVGMSKRHRNQLRENSTGQRWDILNIKKNVKDWNIKLFISFYKIFIIYEYLIIPN